MGNDVYGVEHEAIRDLDYDENIGLPLVPWLDAPTALYLRSLVDHIAEHIPAACAVLLCGSMARHEERPLSDAHPRDVDVLVLLTPSSASDDVATQDTRTAHQHHGLSWAVVHAFAASPVVPRAVQVLGALTGFAHWDPAFVAHVGRDGTLLWPRGPLPSALASIDERRP